MILSIYFTLFALIAVVCAGSLLFARHPLNGAMALVGTMVSLGAIYSLIQSPFLATLQVLVYAGAIMMLVIFVIMVLNSAKDNKVPTRDLTLAMGTLVSLSIGLLVVKILLQTNTTAAADAPRGTVAAIAKELFRFGHTGTGYAVLFEIVGLVLTAAIVGAVLLSKRSLESEIPSEPEHGGH
jgi:NADH-quinone oxidoreductase subunit J